MRPASSGSLREIDARHDVRRAERHLLGLGEEVVRIAIEHQPPDRADRHQLLRHDLGRIEHVEAEAFRLLFGEDLQPELVLGIRARFDRFPQIAAMEVRIGAADLDRLVPVERMRAEHRRPVELHEHGLARLIDQAEGVHAEALHHAVAARNGAVRHDPHLHVHRFGHQRDEIPEGVVRARGLRHREVRLGLQRMHQIRKLHRVLDEEHRDVVADQIPVAFIGVELDREAAHVAHRVGRAALARDGGEAHEHGRALAGFGKERGAREFAERLVALEVAVRRGAARMHDALGNALVIEVRDLLAQDEVFEQRGPAQTRPSASAGCRRPARPDWW